MDAPLSDWLVGHLSSSSFFAIANKSANHSIMHER